MKINNFQGELTDISAKKEALVHRANKITDIRCNKSTSAGTGMVDFASCAHG